MFLGWQRFPLVLEHGQCNDNPGTGLSRVDDIVEEPAVGDDVGIGEFLFVFVDEFLAPFVLASRNAARVSAVSPD